MVTSSARSFSFFKQVSPTALMATPPVSTKSVWESIAANQTFVLIALLIGVHVLLIVVVVSCLWKQTPKRSSLSRTFLDEQREEFKRTIQKKD